MKKVIVCICAIGMFLAVSGPGYAGPNIFSSRNEQYSILSNYHLHSATQSLILANMALLALDTDKMEEALELFKQHRNQADAYMNKIFFTVPVSSQSQNMIELLENIRSSIKQQ